MKVFVVNQELNRALRKLRARLDKDGSLRQLKRRGEFIRPGERRREKHRRAVVRARKVARMMADS